MSIDPADAATHEAVGLDEKQHLPVVDDRRVREGSQEGQDLAPPPEVPAGELADHERVSPHLPGAQALGQRLVASAKMIHPDRGVDEH